jgi:OOP family OmpA-OmpF porin
MQYIYSFLKQIIFLLLFVYSFNSFSQKLVNTDTLRGYQIKRLAVNSNKLGDIYSSIAYYESYLNSHPKSFSNWMKLAHLYLKSRDYTKAEETFKMLFEKDPLNYPDAQFYYARCLKANGKYEEAFNEYNKFSKNKNSKNAEDILTLKKLLKIELANIDSIKNLIQNPGKSIIRHLNTTINKAHIELSPFPIDSMTLLYASLKVDTLETYNLEKFDSLPVRKFYTATFDEDWIGGEAFKGSFNSKNSNLGNGVISQDGNKMYYSDCSPNSKGKMICRIKFSEKVNDTWGEPIDLGPLVNSEEYTSTMPAIGYDSKKNVDLIYFVSDRPGSKGGMDIWFTTYDPKKKIYKAPKNIGGTINTIADEITPSYDLNSSTLYFSSNGHSGLGELDIFYSIGEQKMWSVPENIGLPINSSADDIYFVKSKKKKEKSGFFVSNRKGGISLQNETCCDDIYEFLDPNFISIEIDGKAYEYDSIDHIVGVIPDLPVSLSKVSKDGSEHLMTTTKTDKEGAFHFQVEQGNKYKISAEKNGFYNTKLAVSTDTITKAKTIDINLAVKPLTKNAIVISNIYYETDKADLRPESTQSLDKELVGLLLDNPQLIIEISSHTDEIGSNDYNLRLSQRRAESVVNYLISKGISKDKLKAKGYGETKPIATNATPEGRQKNRRTEFKIIGEIENTSIQYED